MIQCEDIADPVDGQIVFENDKDRRAPFDYGTTAQYSCYDGFNLIGDESMRVCGGDGLTNKGVWSGEDYSCLPEGKKMAKIVLIMLLVL